MNTKYARRLAGLSALCLATGLSGCVSTQPGYSGAKKQSFNSSASAEATSSCISNSWRSQGYRNIYEYDQSGSSHMIAISRGRGNGYMAAVMVEGTSKNSSKASLWLDNMLNAPANIRAAFKSCL